MKTPGSWFAALSLLILAFCVSGCGFSEVGTYSSSSKNPANESGALNVIATTGQINSALTRIAEGTDISVTLFCGPGIDPHSFRASTNDVQKMLDCDLIIYNGFHLEAKLAEHLEDTFASKSWSMASAFPSESRLDWVEDGEVDTEAPYDPHIWNHLPGWSVCVTAMADKLAELDPAHADLFRQNAADYVQEIRETHQWAVERLQQLPADRRVLVSAHDAFNYFARNYDFETLAVLGVGNDAEADIKTMRDVAATVCERKIPAIFLESITNPKVTEALSEACRSRGWDVRIVDQPLYSDDLGDQPPNDTFLGAFRTNVELIFDSLQSSQVVTE